VALLETAGASLEVWRFPLLSVADWLATVVRDARLSWSSAYFNNFYVLSLNVWADLVEFHHLQTLLGGKLWQMCWLCADQGVQSNRQCANVKCYDAYDSFHKQIMYSAFRETKLTWMKLPYANFTCYGLAWCEIKSHSIKYLHSVRLFGSELNFGPSIQHQLNFISVGFSRPFYNELCSGVIKVHFSYLSCSNPVTRFSIEAHSFSPNIRKVIIF
jgi:hypothetical protein